MYRRTCFRRHGLGFSLVELLFVAAIIGILAAVSIPAYNKYVMKARIAEAKANLGTIKILEESYLAENDAYMACAAAPTSVPGTTEGTWTTNAGFTAISFTPAGDVYFQYQVTASGSTSFTATATGDLDGDGSNSVYTITESGGVTGPTGDDY